MYYLVMHGNVKGNISSPDHVRSRHPAYKYIIPKTLMQNAGMIAHNFKWSSALEILMTRLDDPNECVMTWVALERKDPSKWNKVDLQYDKTEMLYSSSSISSILLINILPTSHPTLLTHLSLTSRIDSHPSALTLASANWSRSLAHPLTVSPPNIPPSLLAKASTRSTQAIHSL